MLGSRERVSLTGDMGELALELPMTREALRRQPAIVERRAHGATGFALVATVAEPAIGRDRRDVVERDVDAVVRADDLQRPDAGRVDQQRPAGQLEQLAMGRRMAAALVALADLAGGLALLAEERVDERRLADARRSEDRGRGSWSQALPQLVEAVAPGIPAIPLSARTGATASTAMRRPSTSSATSDLLSTTTGSIPLDHATAR